MADAIQYGIHVTNYAFCMSYQHIISNYFDQILADDLYHQNTNPSFYEVYTFN